MPLSWNCQNKLEYAYDHFFLFCLWGNWGLEGIRHLPTMSQVVISELELEHGKFDPEAHRITICILWTCQQVANYKMPYVIKTGKKKTYQKEKSTSWANGKIIMAEMMKGCFTEVEGKGNSW